MSMQAGIWNFDLKPISQKHLDAIGQAMVQHGPDGGGWHCEPGFAMLVRSFHITMEDLGEVQPVFEECGSTLTWDGRLDNRDELLKWLGRSSQELHTDAEIVSAAL